MSDWVCAGFGLLGWLFAMWVLLGALEFCEDVPTPRPLKSPSNVSRVPAEKPGTDEFWRYPGREGMPGTVD